MIQFIRNEQNNSKRYKTIQETQSIPLKRSKAIQKFSNDPRMPNGQKYFHIFPKRAKRHQTWSFTAIVTLSGAVDATGLLCLVAVIVGVNTTLGGTTVDD